MTESLIFLGSILVVAIIFSGVMIWVTKPSNSCSHVYERIDTYNDEKMILVCQKCGKIKRFKK
jgi:hypothetical protein